MKKTFLILAALLCGCFALKAQQISYEPITAIPSPIDPNAVYVLGYQVGNDYYLHTSGTAAGQMQLSENPANPLEYHIELFTNVASPFVYAHCGTNYLRITNDGVSIGGLDPFNSSPYTLVIQNGDISSASAAASGYTVCHNENNIITVHNTGTSEGNLRFFKPTNGQHLTTDDFVVSDNVATYNGLAQAATVTLGVEGAGTMTVTYKQDGQVVVPINAGAYDIYAAVTEGEQYSAFEAAQVGTLTISKASLTAGNFIFSAPENLTYDGNAKTASVTFDGQNGTLTGCGNITVKYNGSEQAPSTAGEYAVTIDVDDGMNYSAAQGLASDNWNFTIVAPTPANNQIFYKSSDHQVVTPNNASAFGVTITNNTYNTSTDWGTITFSGDVTTIGDYAFSSRTTLTAIVWPSTVTSIGRSAFNGCTNLSSIDLQEGVTSIGTNAFNGCAGMAELAIPSTVSVIGDYAFSGWTTLTKLTVKAGSIGASAFKNCSNLCSIDLQEGITSIGSFAFNGCAGMSELAIPSTVSVIGEYAFGDPAFSSWTTLTKLTVKAGSIGNNAFTNCTNLSTIDLQEGVTSIGNYAFNGCAGTTELILPSTVTSIGMYAFNWTTLTKLTVKAGSIGNNAFQNCTNLSTIDLQEGVTSIGNYAFYGCASMTALTIPSTVTSIGSHAFDGCTNLSTINLQEGVTSIGDYAFLGCASTTDSMTELTIPSTVTSIGTSAFNGCTNLNKLTVKAGDIGWMAFDGCTNLSTIDLQEGVTSIGNYAFNGCTGTTALTIPSTVTSIGEYAFSDRFVSTTAWQNLIKLTVKAGSIGKDAFSNLTALTELTVEAGSIGENAFSGCTNLSTVDLQESVTGIGKKAFHGCAKIAELTIPSTVNTIGEQAFQNCTSLNKLTVKTGSIGANAFNSCTNLSTLVLQEGVTSIGNGAFAGCADIPELTIPSTVTSIGGNAFQNCAGITALTIPSRVTSIGGNAFQDCTNLASITFNNGATGLGNDILSGCANLTHVTFLGYAALADNTFGSVGSAESPANLIIPSTWLSTDKPVNSTTPWHGGYFNCEYADPVKEFLGEMGEPCEDCPAVEVTKGDKTIKLYNPEKVEFKKE